MNSSSEHLLEVARKIGPYSYDADATSAIHKVSNRAYDISNKLLGVNANLSNGWSKVSDTVHQVCNLLQEITDSIYRDVSNFAQETRANENPAVTAVTTANEKAQDVLSQLGLN